jgi:hypothetical protein
MHKQLRPEQVEGLVSNSAVNQEFSNKIREIDRRLKLNGLKYTQWDTLTDHIQQAFSDGLFLTGHCASSPGDYVEGALHNCGCPDVVEQLHHHSPVLIREIEKQQQMLPDVTVKVSEGLGFLNEMIDKLIEQVMLAEKVSDEVQAYEQRVIDSLAGANIQGPMPTADANSNGPDAIMELDGPHIVEIKLGAKDQMGYSTLQYRPNSTSNKFKLVNEKAFDEKDLPLVMTLLDELEPDLKNWVEAIRDPRYPKSSEWERNPEATALGFNTTLEKYMDAADAKFQYKANRGLSKATRKPLGEKAIAKLYASKKTHYIQIGPGKGGKGRSMGLYYLDSNPANLPVPQFRGVTYLETRVLAGGRKKTGEVYSGTDPEFVGRPEPARDPRTGEVIYTGKIKKDADPDAPVTNISNKVYKAQFKTRPAAKDAAGNPLGNGKPFVKVGGSYALTLRFDAKAKGLVESPYTLDEVEGPRGIKAMLADRAARQQQPQEEPTEPEELEIEIEPEESEGL